MSKQIENIEKTSADTKLTFNNGSVIRSVGIKNIQHRNNTMIVYIPESDEVYELDYTNPALDTQGTSTPDELVTFWRDNDFFFNVTEIDVTSLSKRDILILSLRQEGLWDKMDEIFLFEPNNETVSKVGLKGIKTLIDNNMTLASNGWKVDDDSGFGQTGFIPNTDGVNYQQDDASFWCYNFSDPSPVASTISRAIFGLIDSGGGTSYFIRNGNDGVTPSSIEVSINSDAGGVSDVTPGDMAAEGLLYVGRSINTTLRFYHDSVFSNHAQASDGLSEFEFYTNNLNNEDVEDPADELITQSACGFGKALTDAEVLKLEEIIAIYLA